MSSDHAVIDASSRSAATPDARAALWLALLALAVGILSAVGALAGRFELTYAGYASGALGAAAILSLLHARRMLSLRRMALILVLGGAAFGLAALTRLSWSLGFDLADAGRPATGLAAAEVPLLATAWAFGAVAVAALVVGLVKGLGRVLSWFVGITAGVVAPLVVGVAMIQPAVPVLAAAAVAMFALPRHAPTGMRPAARIDAAPSRPLAWLSALFGTVGVVYAFTGSLWSPAATDGTIAMAQGMTLALAAALPLLAAIGVRSRAGVATWGPLTLAILSLGAQAYDFTFVPEWHAPSAAVAAMAGGLALGWWIGARMPAPARSRVLVAVVIGLAYAVPGLFLLRGLSLAVPVIAIVVALLPLPGVRRTRTPVSPGVLTVGRRSGP